MARLAFLRGFPRTAACGRWRFRSRSSLLASSTLISVVSRLGRHAAAFQPVDLLAELGQGRLPFRASAGVERLFAFRWASARRPQGGVVLLLGASCSSRVQRGPLLVQLAAALLGGGDGHAVLGQARRAAC